MGLKDLMNVVDGRDDLIEITDLCEDITFEFGELPEVNNDNYFEDEFYMSVSSFKLYDRCELKGLEGFGEMTEAMLIGSYVDAFVEGTIEKFKEEHPEMISSKGPTKGKPKAGFIQADYICDFIEKDRVIQKYLGGDKQTIMTGQIENVPFKIKIDSYAKGEMISDLKIMKTITNRDGDYYNFIAEWGYDIQLASYQEIVRQNTGEKLPCYIVVVTKENPINSAVISIPQYILDKALERVKESVRHYYRIKRKEIEPVGCGKCGTCISARENTPIIDLEDFEERSY